MPRESSVLRHFLLLIATNEALTYGEVHYFHDGVNHNYDWMVQSCADKGMAMCTFEELCPEGRGQPPVGGQLHANGESQSGGWERDEWVPIAPSDGYSKDWVQFGDRSELCGLHMQHNNWGITPCCCGDWCNTDVVVNWKGIYGCCGESRPMPPSAPPSPPSPPPSPEPAPPLPAPPHPPPLPPAPPAFPPPPASPGIDWSLLSTMWAAAFVCGLVWCTSFVLCMGMKSWLPERYHPVYCLFTFIACSVTGALFWAYLHPQAVNMDPDPEDKKELAGIITGAGALGDLAGIVLAMTLMGIVFPLLKRRSAGRAAKARDARAARAAQVVVQACTPQASAVDVPCNMIVDGVAMNATNHGTSPPPLFELVRVLRRELRLKSEGSDGTLTASINTACTELGVPLEGALIERAHRCWRALDGLVP